MLRLHTSLDHYPIIKSINPLAITLTVMTVPNEIILNERAEDKPRQEDTKIWLKPGKNPKMGKTLYQIFLLLRSNVQQRKRERYN